MPDFTIRPTQKWIRIQYWTVFLVCCLCVGLYVNRFADKPSPWVWLLAVPALFFFFPLRGQLRRHFTKVALAGDKLRYESGLFSKTTHTIPVSKIRDVHAHQTLGQRLLGIGNVTVETAGEASALAIANVDDPQGLMEAILSAQGATPKAKGEPS